MPRAVQRRPRARKRHLAGVVPEVFRPRNYWLASVVFDHQLLFAGHGNLGALGAADQAGLQLLQSNIEVRGNVGEHVAVSAGSCHLERGHLFGALVHVDQLALGNAEGRTVHALAVDHDVAVHHKLAGLGDGAGKAGTQHQGVKTHFQQLDQVFTGQTGGVAGFLEDTGHLCFADAVLGTQTLLFAQTYGVVTVLLAAGASVLAGAVRTTLHVLLSLGRQGNAKGTRNADLAAGSCVVSHDVLPVMCGVMVCWPPSPGERWSTATFSYSPSRARFSPSLNCSRDRRRKNGLPVSQPF